MTQEYEIGICDRCEYDVEAASLEAWGDQELCVSCMAYRKSDPKATALCRRCGQPKPKFFMRCMDAGNAATEWFLCEPCYMSGDYDA